MSIIMILGVAASAVAQLIHTTRKRNERRTKETATPIRNIELDNA